MCAWTTDGGTARLIEADESPKVEVPFDSSKTERDEIWVQVVTSVVEEMPVSKFIITKPRKDCFAKSI